MGCVSSLCDVTTRQEYSKIYRDAGVSAISVNVDPLTGGCTHEDIQQMAKEQLRAANTAVGGGSARGDGGPVVWPKSELHRFGQTCHCLAKPAASGSALVWLPPDPSPRLTPSSLGLASPPPLQHPSR